MEQDNPNRFKIFPRNLTANAAYIVKGNPVSSRPEDTVGNTIPGLEIDERNIEDTFFPGLKFEFQRGSFTSKALIGSDRPLLRRVVENNSYKPFQLGLKDDDAKYPLNNVAQFICLWAVKTADKRLNFYEPKYDNAGVELNVWRAIRDLPQGEVKILIASIETRKNIELFTQVLEYFNGDNVDKLVRDNSTFRWAVITGESQKILSEEGVINTELIEPGELQKTMCNPWQYDFRDCKCYYWAANRPDIAAGSDGKEKYKKFMRKERDQKTILTDDHSAWLQGRKNHVDVINNWEDFPVVLGDTEIFFFQEDVRKQFNFLATVEHALAVEYLFAYYSVDISKKDVATAATEIFNIAVDEMRHFRWVNEILSILGERPRLGRAKDYGENFDNRPFELTQLTREKLQWFINVEKPSQSLDMPGQIDGMYVHLHKIISSNRSEFPQSDRILNLIKLLIDEGEGHYQRFMKAQRLLSKYKQDDYLYKIDTSRLNEEESMWNDMSNYAYEALLISLNIAFSMGDKAKGKEIQKAVRSMQTMDKLNRMNAINRRPPQFNLPKEFDRDEPIDIKKMVESSKTKINKALSFIDNFPELTEPIHEQAQIAKKSMEASKEVLDELGELIQ